MTSRTETMPRRVPSDALREVIQSLHKKRIDARVRRDSDLPVSPPVNDPDQRIAIATQLVEYPLSRAGMRLWRLRNPGQIPPNQFSTTNPDAMRNVLTQLGVIQTEREDPRARDTRGGITTLYKLPGTDKKIMGVTLPLLTGDVDERIRLEKTAKVVSGNEFVAVLDAYGALQKNPEDLTKHYALVLRHVNEAVRESLRRDPKGPTAYYLTIEERAKRIVPSE